MASEPGDVWWEIDIVARNLLKVSLPSGVLRMPPDQARRLAQALNLAADASGGPKRPSTAVQAIRAFMGDDKPRPYTVEDRADMLECADLWEDGQDDAPVSRISVGQGYRRWEATVEQAVAERCAPLVEALERIANDPRGSAYVLVARDALRAFRERTGE